MKRGQAALEFLTTYGWAFIVILVMIGALAYFGVLNPGRALPSRCLVEAGFSCKDFIIRSDQVEILLVNKKGEGLTLYNDMTITSDAGDPDEATCTVSGGLADQVINITCPNANFTNALGDKVKVEFSINYTLSKGTYRQAFSGEVFGPVQ